MVGGDEGSVGRRLTCHGQQDGREETEEEELVHDDCVLW